MTQCLMGQEWEVSASGFDSRGRRIGQSLLTQSLMQVARRQLPHLPDSSGQGMFLANGARLYVDAGEKLEICTPEVCDPLELCRYAQAGEVLLQQLGKLLCETNAAVERLFFTRATISYGRNRATWGCHESYGHQVEMRQLRAQLTSFLATRLIFSGAGGFDCQRSGIHFTLSPRVGFLSVNSSSSSQHGRGIFHTKNEPLNRANYSRLHVISGENLCSPMAKYIQWGSTALVVRLIQHGANFSNVALANPIAAMKTFAADWSCTARAPGVNGSQLSALQVQRRYQQVAEQSLGKRYCPAWAPQLVAAWREILDCVEQDDPRLARRLDWAAKLALFRSHIDRCPFATPQIEAFNRIVGQMQMRHCESEESLAMVPRNFRRVARYAACLPPLDFNLAAAGLNWDDVEQLVVLRDQLFELDTKYGQLGREGIFSQLAARGLIDSHDLVSTAAVNSAIRTPPPATRARLRGRWVRRLSGKSTSNCCDWQSIRDGEKRRVLDLSHPFATTATWRPMLEDAGLESLDLTEQHIRRLSNEGLLQYDRCDYGRALATLNMAQSLQHDSNRSNMQLERYVAWTLGRMSDPSAIDVLDRLHGEDRNNLMAVSDYVYVLRFQGLVPVDGFTSWIQRGLQRIAANPDDQPERIVPILGHHAFWQMCQGENEQANETFQSACQERRMESSHWRANARVLAEYAEARRRLGDLEHARSLLEKATRIQETHNCRGDLADFTWTIQAKLQSMSDRQAAMQTLDQVLQLQSEQQNNIGQLKTLLLLARLDPSTDGGQTLQRLDRISEIQVRRPLLARCPKLAEIMRRWNEWTGPAQSELADGFFWNL